MDLTEYRASESEQKREVDLLNLIRSSADGTGLSLDVGARDGYYSHILTGFFRSVVALDIKPPARTDEGIAYVQGDIVNLGFEDDSFNLVFCTEVLEHIPPDLLERACCELMRVSSKYIIIGVPYRQDTRVGRCLCGCCQRRNPPWGHVNCFNEERLRTLFSSCQVRATSLIGKNKFRTNFLSSALIDMAGNPYGTYDQEEPCIYCGEKLTSPQKMLCYQKVLARLSITLDRCVNRFRQPDANWIHMLFEKT